MHDYLQLWCQRDVFRKLFATLMGRMFELGRLEIDKGFIDATFAAAKGGGEAVGPARKGKGTKIQLTTDAQGIPLAVSINAANVGEDQMVQQTMEFMHEEHRPERMMGDKAYDCDAPDIILADLGVEMISPQRRNRKPENQTQEDASSRSTSTIGSWSGPSPA